MIAIVDDDDDMRQALSDLLLVLGLSSSTYDRAEAFLGEYERGVFACVVTDVRMSGMSGLELLRHLRGLGDSVPVIVITSDGSPNTRRQALEGGAHAFMTKPVEDDVLLGHLQSALGR
ncbi:MAG: response regulator [Reyranella sp.]|nr:response regulator [Reyranella sp.]